MFEKARPFDALPLALGVSVLMFFPILHPRAYDCASGTAMWLLTCLGITVGYHRLFTHQAFKCDLALKIVLGWAGSMAFSVSEREWHRC